MESSDTDILSDLKKEFRNIKCLATEEKSKKSVRNCGECKIGSDKPEIDFTIASAKLDGILTKIKNDSPHYFKALSMAASILYERAKICLNLNLLEESKAYLEKGLQLVEKFIDNSQVTFIYLRIVNFLSYIVSRLNDFDKAKNLLEMVVNSELKCKPVVYSTDDLFLTTKIEDNVSKTKLEKLNINNIQMLGWIYYKLGMTNLYAQTIHKGLQLELDINDGDPVHWATRCCRLASFFIIQDMWENARYHLSAAQIVLDAVELTSSTNASFFKAQGDLARIWVNYGLQLFGISRKSILEKVWDENDEIKPNKKLKSECFTFSGMDIRLPNVPVKEITNVQESRELFSYTHVWLKRARLFYSLRDYPLQYINIILELSELYRFLAYYEKDLDSQYDVTKKRFETLETLSSVLREVRPSCYATMSLEIIREIIDVQLELMNLNLKKLYNPIEDTALNESDLKKRIDIVNDVNVKVGKIYNKRNESKILHIAEDNKEALPGTSDETITEVAHANFVL
ncbi:unnamed protein product [Phyllotreta striolata]|uniref:KIF-binding protein n=1 Tax=Phyllotreta striolata TaxID=444603 RepID=A0A9N9XIX9_PHYSR|nr:unnamed protein product [Phyllotreta striolata]